MLTEAGSNAVTGPGDVTASLASLKRLQRDTSVTALTATLVIRLTRIFGLARTV